MGIDGMLLDIRNYVHAKYAPPGKLWENKIYDSIDIKENDKLLDVGCGNASFWERHYAELPAGVELTLLDKRNTVSKDFIEKQNVKFVCDDICNMTYSSEFNVILAKDMLYLVDDFDTCVVKISNALSTSGRLYGTCYSVNHMMEIYQALDKIGIPSVHQNQYLQFNLENIKEKLGKYFSFIGIYPQEDSLIIKNINDALLFIMSYIADREQHEGVQQELWIYLKKVFCRQKAMVINRKMCFFIAKDIIK